MIKYLLDVLLFSLNCCLLNHYVSMIKLEKFRDDIGIRIKTTQYPLTLI